MYINKKLKRNIAICVFSMISTIILTNSLYALNQKENVLNLTATQIIKNNDIDLAKNINNNEIVLKINNVDISYEKYAYYLAKEKIKIDGGNSSYWENENQMLVSKSSKVTMEDLEIIVLNKMKNIAALESLANEYNIIITNEMVEQKYSQIVNEYGQEAIDNLLKEENISLNLYKEMLKDTIIEEKVFYTIFREDIKNNINKTEFAGYRQILITYEDNNNLFDGEYLTKEINNVDNIPIGDNSSSTKRDITNGVGKVRKLTEQEAISLIDDIYNNIQQGEDFNTMLSKYGESNEFINNETKYVKINTLPKVENDILFELEINEISKPFKNDQGYIIIIRDELSNSYIENNLMYFATDEIWARYNKIINEKAETLETQKTLYYLGAYANSF